MWRRSKCPSETCGCLTILVKRKQLLLSKVVGKVVSGFPLMPEGPALWLVVREEPSLHALSLPVQLPLVRVTSVMLSPLFWEGHCEHWSHSTQASEQPPYSNSFQTWLANVGYTVVSGNFHNLLPVADGLCQVSCCPSVFSCIPSCEEHHLRFPLPFSLFRAISYHLLMTFFSKSDTWFFSLH